MEITNGEVKQSVNFIAVEGMWMPADADAEKWAEGMKKWEETLAGMADGSLLTEGAAQMVPLVLDPILQPAVAAQSAREFHAAMDGWLAMAAPLVAQMSNFGIGNRRGNSYGSGYDSGMDDYYDDMDMDLDMDENYEVDNQ